MKWTKLVKAEKYPKIVKEGNIYHVLYAEGTKSKQFKSKEEAEKYCKSIKAGESYGGYSAFDGTEEQQLFDLMIEHGIITEDEFSLVTDGWGYNLETAETVLYVRTSLRNLKQLKDDLGIKEEVEEVEENDEDYIGNEL